MDALSANCSRPITFSDPSSSRILITCSIPWVRSLFRLWLAARWSNSRHAPLRPLIRIGCPDGSAVLLRCGTFNEHRTVAVTAGLRPSVCLFCLTEDLENNRSQYLRLSWLSSITTICPIHFTPLVTHPTPLPMGTTGRRMAVCAARLAGAPLIAVTFRPSHNLSSPLRALSVYCAPLWQAIESSTWEIGTFPAKACFCSLRMPLGR